MDGLENMAMGSRRKEMVAPCKGCPRKTPGCHDQCQAYKEFQVVVKQKNANLKANQWDVYDRMAPKRGRDL